MAWTWLLVRNPTQFTIITIAASHLNCCNKRFLRICQANKRLCLGKNSIPPHLHRNFCKLTHFFLFFFISINKGGGAPWEQKRKRLKWLETFKLHESTRGKNDFQNDIPTSGMILFQPRFSKCFLWQSSQKLHHLGSLGVLIRNGP